MRHFTERKIGISCIATYVVAVAALCLFVASPVMAAGENCVCEGPGWVGSCPEGLDEIDAQEVLVGIDPYPLGGGVFSFRMTPIGLLKVQRDSSDGGSIQTEILNLKVTDQGAVVVAGIDQGQLASYGAIDGVPGDQLKGESWFEVFVEVRNAGGFPNLWNHTPIYILDTILCVPPKARYMHLGGAVPLYDWPPGGTGDPTPRAYIVDAIHLVNTDIIPTLTEWGMIIFCALLFAWMAWMVVRRKRATEVGI